jgi:hypothetical protein
MLLQTTSAKVNLMTTLRAQLDRKQEDLPHPLAMEASTQIEPLLYRIIANVEELVSADSALL